MAKTSDVKLYDIISESTALNSEGNTMQLQLFQMDSQVSEGARELHGCLVLNTMALPDRQLLKFGFMFAEDSNKGFFDGLQVTTMVDWSLPTQKFVPVDISSAARPNVFADTPTFEEDN